MFLLLFRTAALSLLMAVAVATQPGVACRQEVPAGLIRDLWNRTRETVDRLPMEARLSRRLLPRFCTGCTEASRPPHLPTPPPSPPHVIGWLELQELTGVYQRGVFSSSAIQKLLPLDYNDLLFRLQETLRRCVSGSEPSKWIKFIKKVERKIKKRAENRLKAVREFIFILRWMDELTLKL